MVRTVDYTTRRKAVLAATMNRFIKNAEPVSSEDIAREFDLSPATIRNIFAELEKSGYLTHPYTSGGRIPTKKGYRYYVDFLLSQIELVDDEKGRILHEYQEHIGGLDNMLDYTSEVISAVTHYAGIASFVEWHDKFFYRGLSLVLNQPEFYDTQRIRLLIRMLEERRKLLDIINRDFSERVKIYIGDECGCLELENCALVVSQYEVKGKPSGRVAVLGPVRMEYNHIIPALEYISGVLTTVLRKV